MTAPDRSATYQIALASTGSSTHNAWFPQRMTELSQFAPKGVIEALPDSTSSEPQSDIRRASFDNTESRVAGR